MADLTTPARDDLCRSVPFTSRADAASDDGDGFTLDGYGAVFNSPTRIDSWEGTFDEVIAPGAFKKSLRERTPRLQFDHGTHPLVGSIPIGKITDIGEDDRGLHVVARLSDNWLVEPIRDAITAEAVDGMSFRFSVVRDEWTDEDGKKLSVPQVAEILWDGEDRGLTRTLKEVKVTEVGPVVWPAYEDTTVGVRSKVTIDLGRMEDPAQRKQLARAVLLADKAQQDTRTDNAPPPTASAAGGHASTSDGTPRPTDDLSAGEHESSTSDTRNVNPAREWAIHARRTVLTINRKAAS